MATAVSIAHDITISRRHFLEAAPISGVAGVVGGQTVDQRTGMLTRVLGRTGFRASLLAFGGGSGFYGAYKTDDEGIAALSHALDLGINYIDTAAVYGNGLSEARIGKTNKGRRKGLSIATKLDQRSGDGAKRSTGRIWSTCMPSLPMPTWRRSKPRTAC